MNDLDPRILLETMLARAVERIDRLDEALGAFEQDIAGKHKALDQELERYRIANAQQIQVINSCADRARRMLEADEEAPAPTPTAPSPRLKAAVSQILTSHGLASS